MEAFSLLKYWRGGGAASLPFPPPPPPPPTLDSVPSSLHTTTIVTSAVVPDDNSAAMVDTDHDDDAAGGDDGSFFDLEFSVGEELDDDADELQKGEADSDGDCTDDGDREFNFTLSSPSSSNDRAADLALSPSHELFSQLVESSSDALNPKSQRIPVSLLKSATKFRVFLLGFKKSKDSKITEQRSTEPTGDAAAVATQDPENEDGEKEEKESKLFTVKFKVEEVPIVSLFSRENSSSSSSSKDNAAATSASDERQRFSKEALHKYLKKVKPLYVRVSKRYGEKLRFAGQLNLQQQQQQQQQQQHASVLKSKIEVEGAEKSEVEVTTKAKSGAKQGNLQAGFRVVCKHLGKSRSASSAVAAAPPLPPPPPPPHPQAAAGSQRRDDSLLQQQDGIQSAILHCKRSFNASRDSEFSRSVSDTSQEKSTESSAKACGDDGETSSGSQ